jgi:hypothetical protein
MFVQVYTMNSAPHSDHDNVTPVETLFYAELMNKGKDIHNPHLKAVQLSHCHVVFLTAPAFTKFL